MSAIVEVVGIYGAAPGVITACTTQRYNTAIPSQRDPGLSYPNNVPPTGETYRSGWMFTGLRITGGTYSQLTNFRWGTPGNIATTWALGSGMVQVALKDGATDPGMPYANYEAPTGSAGLYGYDIKDATHGLTYFKSDTIACADADGYDSDNPLVFDSSVITPLSANLYTKFVCHQLVIEDDTTFGEKAEISNFCEWQEI